MPIVIGTANGGVRQVRSGRGGLGVRTTLDLGARENDGPTVRRPARQQACWACNVILPLSPSYTVTVGGVTVHKGGDCERKARAK